MAARAWQAAVGRQELSCLVKAAARDLAWQEALALALRQAPWMSEEQATVDIDDEPISSYRYRQHIIIRATRHGARRHAMYDSRNVTQRVRMPYRSYIYWA